MSDATNAKEATPMMIRLSQRAPWNARLVNPYRTRYALVGGRRFMAESDRLDGLWAVWEVDEDGNVANADKGFVAHAFTLALVRLAVQMRVAGKSDDEIRTAMLTTPRQGTGRNHPRHVARRESWRDGTAGPSPHLAPRPAAG